MICFRRTPVLAAALLLAGSLSGPLSGRIFAQSNSSTLPDAPAVQTTQPGPGQSSPGQTSTGQTDAGQTSPAQPTHPEPQPTGPTVLFNTSMGRITCKLFAKEAPVTVANFVGLATGMKDWTDPKTQQVMHGKPLYNGTIFHRVIPGFMIQGGDPLGTGMGGPGYTFRDELDPNLNFDVAGRLAMANSGPNTDGSQFFITEEPADYLDQKYTIFGQCDDPSVWIVKSIARVNRDANDRPILPVTLDKVTVIPAGQLVPPDVTTAAPSTPAVPDAGATKPQP